MIVGSARILIVLFVLLSGIAFPLKSFAHPTTLRLAVHPFLSASELNRRMQPLCEYLSRESDLHVELFIAKDYQQLVDTLGTGQADLAFMGPSPYVTLTQKYGSFPLLGCLSNGDKTFRGVLVVREDSSLEYPYQLKNKRLAFVDPCSTMGFQTALTLLTSQGLTLEDITFEFLGNHQNVAYGVLMGSFDAGAIKPGVFSEFSGRGLKALAYTEPVAEHPFVAASHLDPALVERLHQAMLRLSDSPQGRAILAEIRPGATAVLAVEDRDYDRLRQIRECIGRQKEGYCE